MNKRPIKFRLWDKVGKFWVSNYAVNPEGNVIFFNFINNFNLIQERCVLMQFTGLYDKNEKEIWEGDVVSLNAEGAYLVTWDEEDCLFKFGHSPVFEACAYKAEIMVIGNVFENSELVEK